MEYKKFKEEPDFFRGFKRLTYGIGIVVAGLGVYETIPNEFKNTIKYACENPVESFVKVKDKVSGGIEKISEEFDKRFSFENVENAGVLEDLDN